MTEEEDEFDISKFDNNKPVPNQELIRDRIYQQIESRLVTDRKRKSGRRLWLSMAASLMLLGGVGLYYLSTRDHKANAGLHQSVSTHHPIIPGTNKAILILGNGNKIDLDQAPNGQIAQEGTVSISKLQNGQLEYKEIVSADDGRGKTTYNTIVTPRGGQYQVKLSDGTSVWLNSASSLKYTSSFTMAERHVELNGEGYFEVAKNKKMPFTINAGKIDVKVLGTHFNIAAYNDDPSSKTTLLEGSVRLTRDDQQITLLPGQQAVAGKIDRQIKIKTLNPNDAIAWKNGYFSFRKETLEAAMRKIARWYDVEVVYQGKISDKLLGGSVLRTQNIDELLSYLETIGIAKFKIEGRRIMVKAN